MSRELEQRLERALGQVESSATAGEQAREAALAALPGGRRGRYRIVLIAAALIIGLAVAGVAMAASATVRQAVGLSPGQPLGPVLHGPPHRRLPPGAAAFAIVAGDRALITTPHSLTRTKPLTGFELSPNGIYAGVGERGRLLAVDPAHAHIVASHRVHGTVTAIAWAPIGIHIAYVVRDGKRSSLHLMDGNFTNDRVVATDVADVTPAWRWDSLALAFVTTRGAVRVDDLWRGAMVRIPAPADAPTTPPDQLAFAPHGNELAVSNAGAAVWVADTSSLRSFFVPRPPAPLGPIANSGIAWLPGHDLLETADQYVQRVHVDRSEGTIVAIAKASSAVAGIVVSPDGRTVALATYGRAVILAAVPPAPTGGYHPGDRPTTLRARVVLYVFPTAVDRQVRLIWR
jgi:hypothetical protein